MVYGDSLSSGYKIGTKNSFASQLERALQKKGYTVHVTNHSVKGATSEDGVRHLNGALAQKPDGVILELGANDMLRHYDLKITQQNLQQILAVLQQQQIPVLLVGMEAAALYPEEYKQDFRQMYINLAIEHEVLLYPFFMQGLWKEDGTQVSEDYFIEDKVHHSEKGVAVMVQHILPAVEQFISEDIADVTTEKE